MKISSPIIDSRNERSIITGMIVSTRFLREVQSILTLDAFQLKFARTIAEWCLDFYKKYKSAPQKNIESIFLTFKAGLNAEKVEMIAEFLESISGEYKRAKNFNVDYILDHAEIYFRTISLQQVHQKIKLHTSKGDIEEGERLIASYKRVARPANIGVNPITDLEAIRKAFSKDTASNMFALPGELGKMIGILKRENLVSILGNPGVGKTWWLMYFAMKATFAGYNTVFVSLEMSQEEMIQRIHCYINAGTLWEHDEAIEIPIFDCESNKNNSCVLQSRTCSVDCESEGYIPCDKCRDSEEKNNFKHTTFQKKINKSELTVKEVIKKVKKLKNLNCISGNLRLVHFPMNTLSIKKLETYLDNLEYYEGFIPDVLVTDYIELFSPEEKHGQERFGIKEIWVGHKSLAQKRKMLVVSGYQGNTIRSREDIGQGNWAEDISGLRLSDLSLALNQSDNEKDNGVVRISKIKHRGNSFSLIKQVTTLYSYDIGRPYLDSYLINKKKT